MLGLIAALGKKLPFFVASQANRISMTRILQIFLNFNAYFNCYSRNLSGTLELVQGGTRIETRLAFFAFHLPVNMAMREDQV